MLSTLSLLPDLQEWQMDFLVSLCLVVQICPICAGTQLFLVAYSFFLFQVPGRDVCPGAKHCRTAAKGQRFQHVLFSGGFCAWRFRIGFLGILGTFFFFFKICWYTPFPPFIFSKKRNGHRTKGSLLGYQMYLPQGTDIFLERVEDSYFQEQQLAAAGTMRFWVSVTVRSFLSLSMSRPSFKCQKQFLAKPACQ